MSFYVIKRLLESFLVFFPMGFILRYIYLDRKVALRYVVLTSFVIAFSVEYAQGWIEGRYPGITDVLTGIAGALAGFWACSRWSAAFDGPVPARSTQGEPGRQTTRGGARPAGSGLFGRDAALERMRRRYLKQAERERRKER
jgi:hypothetical protein